jgi:2-polyprenyl-3-methyl-5-hydroxy-6-metoxy-1,4-benzoquinol methylase
MAGSSSESRRAKRYFDRLAPEYNRAFERLGGIVNRFPRGRTFARRMEVLDGVLRGLELEGKTVLDLGCGSGQVSLLAASFGARVHGIDIAPRMLDLARESARDAGVDDRVEFEEGDVLTASLPQADVTLLVGVVEYYRDYEELIGRAARATRETLVVAHTTRVLYRMALRRIMFALQRASVHFHRADDLVRAAENAGFRVEREEREHAFTVLVLRRHG